MIDFTNMRSDFNQIVGEAGIPVRIRHYTASYGGGGSYFDDKTSLTASGNDIWASGIVQPISDIKGSYDAILMEQGRILERDSKLFINGNVPTSGIVKIGVGSPINEEYSIITDGVYAPQFTGSPVYKKIYMRVLLNGSLDGE